MATVVSQHVRHLAVPIFEFSKIVLFAKLQQILLELLENICF